MRDTLGEKIMTKFVAFRAKFDYSEDKKCKGIKKCVVRKSLSILSFKKQFTFFF